MKIHRFFILQALVGLLMAGCIPAAPTMVTSAVKTATLYPVKRIPPTYTATSTATLRSTPTFTPTDHPTAAWASETAQAPLPIMPTSVPSATSLPPTPTTPAVLADLDTVSLASADKPGWGASPDGQWYWALDRTHQIFVPGSVDIIYALALVRADGKARWAAHPEVSDLSKENEWVDIFYYPLFWQMSGPYLYMAGVGCCSEPIFGPKLANRKDLVRINLDTGSVEKITRGWKDHYYLFSPGGEYYLDVLRGTPQVGVIWLADGRRKNITLPKGYDDLGNGSISPDQQHALLFSHVPGMGRQSGKRFALLRLDVSEREYKVLIPDLDEAFGRYEPFPRIEWLDDTHARLTNSIRSEDGRPALVVDILSGEINPES